MRRFAQSTAGGAGRSAANVFALGAAIEATPDGVRHRDNTYTHERRTHTRTHIHLLRLRMQMYDITVGIENLGIW